MQRGQLPMEAIVQIILRVLGVAVLAVILYFLISPFIARAKTPAEQDFQRVLNEFDEVMKQPYDNEVITLRVPITRAVQIVAYGGGPSGAEQCKGKPCICLNDAGRETCKIYNSLKTECSAQCGEVQCIKTTVARSENSVITIKRGCNAIGFEGVEV